MTAARFAADLAAMLAERFERGEIGRRRFLALLGAAGLAPAVLRSGEASAATKEIIIANFGGDAVPTWQKAWGDPYNAESGNKATVIGAEPSAGAIKAQVELGKVTWDCTDGDLFYGPVLGPQKLIQKYDYTKVDKAKVRPEFVTDWGCAAYLYSTVNAYNKEKTGGRAPNGYKDYLNFKDFPGKRAMYKWLVGSLEAVLIGSGVEPDKVYPLDVDKAFALIRDHKDQFLLWGGGAASQQLFRDGEVVMGCLWSTRASVLDRDTGGRLTWVWDHGVVAPGVLQVLAEQPRRPLGVGLHRQHPGPEAADRAPEAARQRPGQPGRRRHGSRRSWQRIDCGYEPNYRRQIPINTKWYSENYERVQNDFLDLMSG